MVTFTVSFEEVRASFDVTFQSLQAKFDIRFGAGMGDYYSYAGPYIVTPSTEAQSLHTARKNMKHDVTVKAIPFAETSNHSGGLTVTIG